MHKVPKAVVRRGMYTLLYLIVSAHPECARRFAIERGWLEIVTQRPIRRVALRLLKTASQVQRNIAGWRCCCCRHPDMRLEANTCNSNARKGTLCGGRRTSHRQQQSAMNHLANDARLLYEKGGAVVATRSLRITDFLVASRRCVTSLSLFQHASVDLWSACRYSSSASNSCKARHVEALKNKRCNGSN